MAASAMTAKLRFEGGDLLLSLELGLRGCGFGGDDSFFDLDGAGSCGSDGVGAASSLLVGLIRRSAR